MSDTQPDPYIDAMAVKHNSEYEGAHAPVSALARGTLPWDERKPAHGDANWSATCDWGDCDKPTVTVRWEDRLKQWLCVCAGHAPDRDARCAALHPSHQAWECE